MNLFHTIAGAMDNDIPDPNIFFKILKFLVPDEQPIEPDEIYEYFKGAESLDSVHLGNIHIDILFSKITSALHELGVECNYFVNAMDSHFYLFGNGINSFIEFKEVLENEGVEVTP